MIEANDRAPFARERVIDRQRDAAVAIRKWTTPHQHPDVEKRRCQQPPGRKPSLAITRCLQANRPSRPSSEGNGHIEQPDSAPIGKQNGIADALDGNAERRLGRATILDYAGKPMANLYIALMRLLGVRLGADGKPAPNGTKDIATFGLDGTAPLDQLA